MQNQTEPSSNKTGGFVLIYKGRLSSKIRERYSMERNEAIDTLALCAQYPQAKDSTIVEVDDIGMWEIYDLVATQYRASV